MKKSSLFFILTIIGIAITITLICLSAYHHNKAYEVSMGSALEHWENQKEYRNKIDSEKEKGNLLTYTSIVVGGISVAFFTTGIILKKKEKRESF